MLMKTANLVLVVVAACLVCGTASGGEKDDRSARTIDMPALKRAQYLRTLAPPQEPPLDVTKWIELYAQYGVPMHVGEFSVIGLANNKSSRSAYLWTKDSIDLFEHLGASWHLWNAGFGLGNERVRELVYGLWEKQWEGKQK